MAGYSGYSESNNSLAAKSDGRWPLTHAVKLVADATGCTKKAAREACIAVGPCEWHHTSKHYNKTDFYSVAEAAAFINHKPLRAAMEQVNAYARINAAFHATNLDMSLAERKAIIEPAYTAIATEIGITPALVEALYYEDYATLAEEEE